MKQKIYPYVFTFLAILLTSFLLSITLVFLEKFIKDEKTNQIILSTISILVYLVFSIILGKKIKSNGLIHGLIFSLFYLFIAIFIITVPYNLVSISLVIAKMITITTGTIIGVNLAN